MELWCPRNEVKRPPLEYRIELQPRIELLPPIPPSTFGEMEYGCEYGTVGHSIANQLASQKGLAHKIAFPGPEAVQLHKRHRPLNQNLVLTFIPNWRVCKGYTLETCFNGCYLFAVKINGTLSCT